MADDETNDDVPTPELVQTTACEHCGVGLAMSPRIRVEMMPGPDGIPWFLCIRCWSEGRRKQNDTTAMPSSDPVKISAPPPRKRRKAG